MSCSSCQCVIKCSFTQGKMKINKSCLFRYLNRCLLLWVYLPTEVNRRWERFKYRGWRQTVFKWKINLFFFFFSKGDWIFFWLPQIKFSHFSISRAILPFTYPPGCSDEKFSEGAALQQHHPCSTKHPEPETMPTPPPTRQIHAHTSFTLLHCVPSFSSAWG